MKKKYFACAMGLVLEMCIRDSRYITDRFLPDKAIDLVDEACALIKTEMDLSLIHI